MAKHCTSFEVEKEPAIAEVEVRKVAILVHVLKQFWVQNLQMVKSKVSTEASILAYSPLWSAWNNNFSFFSRMLQDIGLVIS